MNFYHYSQNLKWSHLEKGDERPNKIQEHQRNRPKPTKLMYVIHSIQKRKISLVNLPRISCTMQRTV